MNDHELQVSPSGIHLVEDNQRSRLIAPNSPEWFHWFSDTNNQRIVFVHPTLGRFVMRHERKQRGNWYWSIYRRSNGRLRKAYLGKGEQLSLQRLQTVAHSFEETQSSVGLNPAPTPNSMPLLVSKLTPPPIGQRSLARPRLFQRLDQAIAQPLTLLVAPAGSGKTMLLSFWVQQLERSGADQFGQPIRVAWLALDRHDNDPARFLAYFCAACQRVEPQVAEISLGLLQAPQPVTASALLTPLLNALAATNATLVLAIDDYHLIDNQQIHEAISFILDHQPPNLRLVLAGRSEPPLALARRRVYGQLSEIGPNDLRFQPEEVHHFFKSCMGLALSNEQEQLLAQRAEGWAVALYLLGVMAGHQEQGLAAIADLPNSQRAIFDYLASEVFDQQRPEVQAFLLRTAFLSEFSASLCEAVCPSDPTSPAASEILSELERSNLFLVELEGGWYRYHQLFNDFLRDRLQRQSPEIVRDVRRRAALWYADEDMMLEAIDHALAVDFELAAELIERCGRAQLMRSALTTVLGWIECLPIKLPTSRPHLGLIAAWALAASGQLDKATLFIDAIEPLILAQGADSELYGEALAVRAAISGLRREVPSTLQICQRALQHLSPSQSYVRSVVSQLLGGAAYASGDVIGASAALAEALQLAQLSGNHFITAFSTRQLAEVRLSQGRVEEAEQLYQQVLGLDPQRGSEHIDMPVAGMAAVGLGELALRRNQRDRALALVMRGLRAGERGQDLEIVLRAQLALARIYAIAGDAQAAQQHLQEASRVGLGNAQWFDFLIQTESARCAWLLGDQSQAMAWAQRSLFDFQMVPNFMFEAAYLVFLRIHLREAQSSHDLSTLELIVRQLDRLAEQARAEQRIASQLEIALIMAEALHRLGQIERADAQLELVLRLGAPSDYLRCYLDGGSAIQALVWRVLRNSSLDSQQRMQLQALYEQFGKRPLEPLADSYEVLTQRELEVMKLLASGRTNHEIAQALVVSLATVKKHLSNLYAKLGVTNRTAAIARARSLNLVD
jgi:ATP-dependent transcriptional regulator